MNESCLRQIRYWDKALKQSQKGHKRKNRKIKNLQFQVLELEGDVRELMLEIAKIVALEQQINENDAKIAYLERQVDEFELLLKMSAVEIPTNEEHETYTQTFIKIDHFPSGIYAYQILAGQKAVFNAPTTAIANLWLQDPSQYVVGPGRCSFIEPISVVHIQSYEE